MKAGLAYLDSHAGLSRRGTDGFEQIQTDGLVAALFDHRTSRAGDPQLHTHALVLNKVRCADGRWRTLDATELFHHKKSAGMIYQSALRNEMNQRLGVLFEQVNEHGQAEIRGVPTELLKMWSKRTAAIDIEALPKITEYEKLLGRTLSRAERATVMKTAVLKTRPGKTHPEGSALHATWAEEAARAGWTPERLGDHVPTPVRSAPAQSEAETLPRSGRQPCPPIPPIPPKASRVLPTRSRQSCPRTTANLSGPELQTGRWCWRGCRPRACGGRCSPARTSPARSPPASPPPGCRPSRWWRGSSSSPTLPSR